MTTTAPTEPALSSGAATDHSPDPREAELRIGVLRDQIDAVDSAIIRLVSQRIELSKNVGKLRTAAGGPRLSLRRENQIIAKFGTKLGGEGTTLAMLLLRASRGRL